MPSVRALGASFGSVGRPATARERARAGRPCGNCSVVVSGGWGNCWSSKERGTVRASSSWRSPAPDPIGFPERRPIGGVRGSLMSGRQKKSYWGRARSVTRTGAESVCCDRQVAETVAHLTCHPMIPSGGIQVSGEPLELSELRVARIKDKRLLAAVRTSPAGCPDFRASSASEVVEHVGPLLHELDPFAPISRDCKRGGSSCSLGGRAPPRSRQG